MPRAARSIATLGAVLLAAAGVPAATAAAREHHPRSVQRVYDDGPRLLRFMYGMQGPAGSPYAYLGLRLATFDPNARVLMVDVMQVAPTRVHIARLQRGCLPEESNGVFHAWVIPGALAPGWYKYRILLYSATCISGDARPEMRRVTRTLEIPSTDDGAAQPPAWGL